MNEQKIQFLKKQFAKSIQHEIDLYIKFGLDEKIIQEILKKVLTN